MPASWLLSGGWKWGVGLRFMAACGAIYDTFPSKYSRFASDAVEMQKLGSHRRQHWLSEVQSLVKINSHTPAHVQRVTGLDNCVGCTLDPKGLKLPAIVPCGKAASRMSSTWNFKGNAYRCQGHKLRWQGKNLMPQLLLLLCISTLPPHPLHSLANKTWKSCSPFRCDAVMYAAKYFLAIA